MLVGTVFIHLTVSYCNPTLWLNYLRNIIFLEHNFPKRFIPQKPLLVTSDYIFLFIKILIHFYPFIVMFNLVEHLLNKDLLDWSLLHTF